MSSPAPRHSKPWHERISSLGFGGASFGNLFAEISDAQAADTLRTALASGISHVDTAPFYGYGLSETRIGQILERFDPDQECLVSTKVGRLLERAEQPPAGSMFVVDEPCEVVYDYSYDGVMRSWTESRRRLKREHIDVLLAHDLGRLTHGDRHQRHFDAFVNGGYRALRDAKEQGDIAAIGIGVNEVEVCLELLEVLDLDVILLAGRYTLLEQSPLDRLLPLCEQKGVRVIVGGPYNSGVLATGASGNGHYNYGQVPPDIRAKVAHLEQICMAHKVPLSAAALQFPLAHPQVISVIPGIANVEQLQAAVAGMATAIPDELWHDMKREQLVRADAPVGLRQRHDAALPHHGESNV